MFLYYKSDLIQLLNDMLHFWNSRKFASANLIYQYLNTGQNCFIASSLVVITTMFLRPALNNNSKYIFHCYEPESFTLDTITLACQYYFVAIVLCITGSYDFMYISYSVHIIIQLRLLKHKLRNSIGDQDIATLHNCVKHHQLLLS